MKTIANFSIPYFQFLDENSEILSPDPLLTNRKELLKLYELMHCVRAFDQKAIALQRTGKLGTYPSSRGQEAVFVGMGYALEPNDVFIPYYRDIGTLIQRGVKLSEILLYWGGDERGNAFANNLHDFPYSVPVGSQVLHATGVAYAKKYQNASSAVLTSCGDGATSQGDFYEALNVAGIWKLPVVFVVCNNQWAISVARQAQTQAETLAQKAISAGIYGEQVDGNDIIAVSSRVSYALEQARKNQVPSLLEIICYRQSDHTTADDASRYEPSTLRALEWKKEPIARLKNYLTNALGFTDQEEQNILLRCQNEIEKEMNIYANTPPQSPSSIFDHLYHQLPALYHAQREEVLKMEHNTHA